MNLIGKKKIFFFISILVLVPGIISLILFGVRFSIDFTGGSVYEWEITEAVTEDSLKDVYVTEQVQLESVQSSGLNRYLIKTKPVDNSVNEALKTRMSEKFPGSRQVAFETVGPSIGRETTEKALIAVLLASAAILLYIAYSFREIPKPYSSFRFGMTAIIAVLHDVFVVLGAFSLLGYFYGVEVNTLFITALLTVIGFSVHDTIVVFDRIRENLAKLKGRSFEEVVNFSLVETLNRSLKTSLTVIFALFALLLLGGESIKWFVFALLIGISSGTFSSIFTAAPILVVWEKLSNKRS